MSLPPYIDQKPLPLLPGEVPEEEYYPSHRVVHLPPSDAQWHNEIPDNPLIPPSMDNADEYFEYSETSSSGFYRTSLSRITEVSERLEAGDTVHPSVPSQASRTVSTWSSQTDYGQVIGVHFRSPDKFFLAQLL